MKSRQVFFLLAAVVLFGCVPSLHPLYTDQTLVFDPQIGGRWRQAESDNIWEFVPNASKKSYTVTVHEAQDKQSKLIARLVEIDGQRVFDFFPSREAEIEAADILLLHMIAGHLFVKVDQPAPNRIELAVMNPQTIDDLLKEKPDLVKHERAEGRVILTDQPKGLQAFVKAGLEIDDFFSEPSVLNRVSQSD